MNAQNRQEIGQQLPSIKMKIDQGRIDTYGEAQGENDPIHHDQEWAQKNSMFGGTIAQGMMSMAFISQMITAQFGLYWVNDGVLDVTFLYPVKPGDTISTQGQVVKITESTDGKRITCAINCTNQDDRIVLSGSIEIVV